MALGGVASAATGTMVVPSIAPGGATAADVFWMDGKDTPPLSADVMYVVNCGRWVLSCPQSEKPVLFARLTPCAWRGPLARGVWTIYTSIFITTHAGKPIDGVLGPGEWVKTTQRRRR